MDSHASESILLSEAPSDNKQIKVDNRISATRGRCKRLFMAAQDSSKAGVANKEGVSVAHYRWRKQQKDVVE